MPLVMRRLRRSAAALLGVLLLQVLFLGAGASCLPAGATTAMPEAAAHEGHDAHAGHGGATMPDEDAGGGGRMPGHESGPAHCVVAMSCATAGLAAARTALDEEPATPATIVVAHDDTAPASVRGAPEPPPPRG